MNKKEVISLISKRGAKASSNSESKKLNDVVEECRKYIEEKNTVEKQGEISGERRKENIKQEIYNYVMDKKPKVEGFIDLNDKVDTIKLMDKLVSEITDYAILTEAMNNPDINEIRINGREIVVEMKGRASTLTDREGKIVRFNSVEQQEIVSRKLLGDVRLTPKDSIVNARTIEGYRVAAVHCSAISQDAEDLTLGKYHAAVIRKFQKSKMSLSDIVKTKTMSDEMAQLCSLAVKCMRTFVTCGPTASGKTTTNNAILKDTPKGVRLVVIQNPSEIELREKDTTGRVVNDVLMLEAREVENPRPSDNTMENLINHTLRLSPSIVCIGEVRNNSEFEKANKILQAGHPVNLTFHAETVEGAVQRYVAAYRAASGDTIDTAMYIVCSLLKIVIIQSILPDGRRKVLEIAEILGVNEHNINKPVINTLFKFVPSDEHIYNNNGELDTICGVHERIGELSADFVDKLKLSGIRKEEYENLVGAKFRSQTYTGNYERGNR